MPDDPIRTADPIARREVLIAFALAAAIIVVASGELLALAALLPIAIALLVVTNARD